MDAGTDAAPWFPSLPVREVIAADAACPPLPPPTRRYDPVPPGETPRLLFNKAPATDPEISAGLIAREIRSVRFPYYVGFSKMPDGAIALLVNPVDALFITPDGRFAEAAYVSQDWTPIVGLGGDWVIRRGDSGAAFINYHDALVVGGVGVEPLSPSMDGRALHALPAIQSTSRAVFAAGSHSLVQACTATSTARWIVRYDESRARAAFDAAYYEVFSTEDESILFAPGGTEIYKFSSDGDVVVHAAAPGADAGWIYYHALAYVPSCGLYVIARDARDDRRALERWSVDLERLWSFAPPEEAGLELSRIEAQFSVLADCGVLTSYIFEPPGGSRVGGRFKIGSGGREQWRRLYQPGDVNPPLPAFALRDGGFLIVGQRDDGAGTGVLRFASDGSRTSDFLVPSSVERGVVIDRSPVLTADGILYWGADRGVGSSWAIVAVATGAEPAPYGWQGSGGSAFRTNGVTW